MTTAPALDVRDHVRAIKAAIDAQFGTSGWHAYNFGEAPGDPQNPVEAQRRLSLPPIYALVAVERRNLPWRRSVTAQAGRSGWRAAVRAMGRSVDESLWALDRVHLALDEAILTVGGMVTTPIQHETSLSPEWDSGRFSALSAFTYIA